MPVRGLGRKALLNFGGQALPLVVGFLAIPITMRWLGPERFGVLALLWVVIGYFNVFDLGLGRATTKFVAEAGGDDARVRSVVGTAATAQAVLGLLGAAVVWVWAPALIDRVLSLPPRVADEATRAFALMGLAAPVLLVSTSLRGTLEAAQRFGLVNAVRAPVASGAFLLPLVGARMGWGLPGIVLSLLLLQAVGALLQYALCVHVFPGLRRPRVELPMLRRLLAFGGWVAVSGLVAPLLVYVDRFAVAGVLSVAAVAQYAAPHEVVIRLSIIPTSLVAVLFPAFSAGRGSPGQVAALAARGLRALLLTMGPVVLVVVALADDLVRLWLGAGFQDLTSVLQILAVGAFVNSLAHVPYAMLQALGRPDVPGKLHLLELPLHLLLVWVLVGAFGLVGAAVAWSIRVALDAALLFLAAARLGPLGYRSLRSSGVPALGASVGLLAAAALGIAAAVPTFPLRTAAILLTLAAAGAAALQPGRRTRLAALPTTSLPRT